MDLLTTPLAVEAAIAGVVLVAAAVFSRLARAVLAVWLGHVAARRLQGRRTWWAWRTRTARRAEWRSGLAEARRKQRIDAVAVAVSRVIAVVIWAATIITLLHRHGISVSVAVSGAGFVGLVLALGAQTSVSDYVTGIHVLFEDRFGDGDEIEVLTAGGRSIRGTVVGHGMFATRIQTDDAVHHISNRMMTEVSNFSQMGAVTTFDVAGEAETAAVLDAIDRTAATRPTIPVTVFEGLESLADDASPIRTRVRLRTSEPLGATDQHVLGEALQSVTNEVHPSNGGHSALGERR